MPVPLWTWATDGWSANQWTIALAQMLDIERGYPNVHLIIAHIGRAYCIEDIGDAFDVLRDT